MVLADIVPVPLPISPGVLSFGDLVMDFGVADLYVLLSMRRVNPRYLRHFLSLVPS